MGWLFILIPVVVIVALVVYHQRKVKAREAASQERFKALLSSVRQGAEAAKPASAPVTEVNTAPARPAEFLARPLLLPPHLSVVYYLLMSSLRQHQILAQVSLGALLEIAPGSTGFEREARETRLAARVDFVVCDAGFKVVAVVNASGSKPALRSCCEGAGVRWVEVTTESPPSQAQMRDWVMGNKSNKNN